jgi:hypothetical protein
MAHRIRLLTTHDFFGSFAVVPTSYGSLPGGESLRATVDAFRAGRSAIWVDSGDFSQGGALSLATSGAGGFKAARELGFDVSVVGNHDLDFGQDFLGRHAEDLNFPLLSANVNLGLPATTIIPTPDGDVGIIGLTHHNLASMASWSINPSRSMPQVDDQIGFDVVGAAGELRRAGASLVICVCHDGVDWHFNSAGDYIAHPDAFFARCLPWHVDVDVIVAGHTLGRYFGRLKNTPIVQPWPLGSELAVVDIEVSQHGLQTHLDSVVISPGEQWRGSGSDVIHAAETEILGHLNQPLEARAHGPAPLAKFVANAASIVSDVDVTLAYTTCGQPTIDGVFSYLGAGSVSRLQMLQIVPYTDFTIVTTEIARNELDQVLALTKPRPQDRTTAWGSFGEPKPMADNIKIATLAGAGVDVIEKLLKRELRWSTDGTTLDTGIRRLLS